MFVDEINAKNDVMAYKIIKIFADSHVPIAVRWCLYYTFEVNGTNFSFKNWRNRNEKNLFSLKYQINMSPTPSFWEARCITDWMWDCRDEYELKRKDESLIQTIRTCFFDS